MLAQGYFAIFAVLLLAAIGLGVGVASSEKPGSWASSENNLMWAGFLLVIPVPIWAVGFLFWLLLEGLLVKNFLRGEALLFAWFVIAAACVLVGVYMLAYALTKFLCLFAEKMQVLEDEIGALRRHLVSEEVGNDTTTEPTITN